MYSRKYVITLNNAVNNIRHLPELQNAISTFEALLKIVNIFPNICYTLKIRGNLILFKRPNLIVKYVKVIYSCDNKLFAFCTSHACTKKECKQKVLFHGNRKKTFFSE